MPIITKQFQVNANGTKFWGVIHLPDGYETTPSKLICFSHGIGEAGWQEQDAANVIGFSPIAFADRLPGGIMVIALQAPGWSPLPDQWAYVLQNDIFKNYKIDRSVVCATGLSAGGQTALSCITAPGMMELFTHCIPMSPANVGNLQYIPQAVARKIKVWGLSGAIDGQFTNNLKTFTAAYKAAGGDIKQTIWTEVKNPDTGVIVGGGGHGGWTHFYNPKWKDTDGKSLYDWLLGTAIPIQPPIPPVQPEPVFKVKAPDDFTTSDPTVKLEAVITGEWDYGTARWVIVESPQEPILIGGGGWISFLVVLKKAGKHVFEFNVKSLKEYNGKKLEAKDSVTVIYQPVVKPEIFTEFDLDGKHVIIYMDKTREIV